MVVVGSSVFAGVIVVGPSVFARVVVGPGVLSCHDNPGATWI